MKVPPKRKGNPHHRQHPRLPLHSLNESPSEKEGKFLTIRRARCVMCASMKVPPKRKGNPNPPPYLTLCTPCLNESPSEKEGKLLFLGVLFLPLGSLNESPSEKEGK